MSNPITPKTLFTRAEAADLCGVSVDTIKRDLREDRYPNADDSSGRWMIPAADLVAAGRLDAALLASAEETLTRRLESRRVQELTEQVRDLQSRLAAHEQIEGVLTLAIEHLKAVNKQLATALATRGEVA